MTVNELIEKSGFKALNLADGDREISGIYNCDLMSVVMSKGFAGAAWVTIMANINAVAVAALTDMACVILAEGAAVDQLMIDKAKTQEINVIQSDKPIFETSLEIHELIKNA